MQKHLVTIMNAGQNGALSRLIHTHGRPQPPACTAPLQAPPQLAITYTHPLCRLRHGTPREERTRRLRPETWLAAAPNLLRV